MTLLIILAIVALLVLWVIGVQRKLVEKDELCKNALSQIGVQQASRWDALTALVELVKSYNEHEYNTLRDVIAQRKNITGESTVAEAQAQEQVLTGLVRNINLVAEQYPELKANENYAKAMDSVNLYENQVRLSRMTFNDTVTKFNKEIRQFPTSIVAGMLGFKTRDYLDEAVGKSDMPSMKI
ncbi:MAG: LemA family protein [Bacteroidales bacterium]|jgi:LemA protein|nr:LemA family protein [Bacteroidales bacterium]MBQ4191836.1 LemA family protein [Bacteroidales bacterium]MBQ6291928.1 LemA family protein [Bacteroidales bacterium]MBR4479724.1 LemA family protein [Bacteroidales bacterium]